MSGNVWMFSDEIDDEDLEFMRHDYVTYNMACEYYRLGIKPVVRMAHEAGAVYKIGKGSSFRHLFCSGNKGAGRLCIESGAGNSCLNLSGSGYTDC